MRNLFRTRTRKAVIISGVILGLLVILGAAQHRAPAVSTPQAAPSATHRPPAAVPSTQPDPAADIAAWWAVSGQDSTDAVRADLAAVSTDADSGDLAAAQADGVLLAADAEAALASPPPVPAVAGPYKAGMTQFTLAGNDLATGDITGATAALGRGTADISAATAALPAS
jgi:hypothetical protein